MHYRKIDHSGSAFLADTIVAMYELNSPGEGVCYKTIPCGLIGLTLLLEGEAWYRSGDKWIPVPRFGTYGLIRKPTIIKTSGNCRDFSIGFKPFLLSTFLKLPMSLISDQFTDAECLFLKQDLCDLREKILAAHSDQEKIRHVEEFLLNYFNGFNDLHLLKANDKIARNQYTRVSQLSDDLNVSSRTLLNKFNSKIGLSPKELMKIHRINSSLNIKVHSPENLTDLAYKLGYFDQAHFIHDFKETLGITPEKYFSSKDLISDFYNLERWSLD
jgi:AraC-like DNA-binding protein